MPKASPKRILPVVLLSAAMAIGASSFAAAQDQAGPSADPGAAHNPAMKSPDAMSSGPLAKGHNSFTKGQARSRIEKAGYSAVSGLTLDADGLWQATAMQNGQSVHVALDYKGNVAAQ
jgi:hypothetical protein